MAAIISLKEFVEGLQMYSGQIEAYLNLVTGEIIPVSEDALAAIESGMDGDDLKNLDEELDPELLDKLQNSDEYIQFPSRFEINEYRMLEGFSSSYPDEKIGDILYDAIHGSGAFGRFKKMVNHFEIQDAWYQYRDRAYKEFAIDWLDSHRISYRDDMETGQ